MDPIGWRVGIVYLWVHTVSNMDAVYLSAPKDKPKFSQIEHVQK